MLPPPGLATWVGLKAEDSSGNRQRAKAVVRAETDSGRKLSVAANLKVSGNDEGAVCIDVETFGGTWVSIALDPDGRISGYRRGEKSMSAAR